MSVIVRMRSEDLFYEVDEEKSRDKCIDRELSLFERFWKDMYDCYREHRTRTESNEEIQDASTDSLPYIEKESRCRDEREDEKREEHSKRVRREKRKSYFTDTLQVLYLEEMD